MKKLLVFLVCLVLAVPGFAEWADKDFDGKTEITLSAMKEQLLLAPAKVLYVREGEEDQVAVYCCTGKISAVAQLIATELEPYQLTYVYCNYKKLYKDVASRIRYYAGRYYDFGGYRLLAEKEGAKEIDGKLVYRFWVKKVEMPKRVIVYDDYLPPPPPPIMIGVWGWPGGHHHHHPGPPPR